MNTYMTIIVALIISIPPLLAAIFSRNGTKKDLAEIHILVNGRMSDAMEEIKELRDFIEEHTVEDGIRRFDKIPPPGPVTTAVDLLEGKTTEGKKLP